MKTKNRLVTSLILICGFFYTNHMFSQTSCATAAPFCTGSSVTFPASTNQPSQPGPNYGCLFTQPNPAWYYMQAATSGNIIIDIAGTGGGDVDYICWGPFTSPTSCGASLTAGNTVSCSYSSSFTETCTINGAVAGQFYMLLITNYSNINQNIQFGLDPSSSATTNCGILSTATSFTACPGAVTTLSVSTNIGSPTFTWMPGGANTASVNVSPTVTTIYTVSIAGTETATATYTTDTRTSTVTVVPLATVSISSGTYCPGSTGVITASTNGVASYTWSGPGYNNTTTVGSITIPNLQPSSSGVYNVTVENTYSCTSTASTNLVVIPTSTIAVTSSVSACQNTSFSLTANAVNATRYNWTGPLGYTAQNTQYPVINNAQPNQSGTYTVTAIFGTGTATCQTRNTVTVTVIPLVTISLTPMPTTCYNGNINLTGPNGATSYTWTGPGGFSSNQQSPVINNANTANQGVYSLQATTNGCTNSGTISVSVYDSLHITSISASTVICNKQSTSLSASGIGGSGAYGYSWSPVLSLSSPNTSTTVANPNATQSYTFALSDANCTITPVATSVITVSVNPLPVITFTTPINEGCEPFSAFINAQSTPASANCAWKFTRGLTANGCNLSGMLFSIPGTYNATLTVTDVNGCIDSLSQNAFIKVDPKPVPDFDLFPQAPTILTNEVTFTDKSTVGAPMQRWHWNFNDQYTTADKDTSALQNPIHVFEQSGTFNIQLKVVNQFTCVDSITRPLIVDDEFALYIPNAFTPSRPDGVNDNFIVKGIGFSASSFEMLIFDRWGEQIYRTNDINKGWDGTVKGGVKAKQDVYVYKITVTDIKLKDHVFVGHVTLL